MHGNKQVACVGRILLVCSPEMRFILCFIFFHPEPGAGGRAAERILRGESQAALCSWPPHSQRVAGAFRVSGPGDLDVVDPRAAPLLGWLWPGQECPLRGLSAQRGAGQAPGVLGPGGEVSVGRRPGLAVAGPPAHHRPCPVCCCRCNTQDYIWHKGTRCESIVTDFQVMCVAVGAAALVLLLLFMVTVFFAKKLYLLRTENTKLRRTQ